MIDAAVFGILSGLFRKNKLRNTLKWKKTTSPAIRSSTDHLDPYNTGILMDYNDTYYLIVSYQAVHRYRKVNQNIDAGCWWATAAPVTKPVLCGDFLVAMTGDFKITYIDLKTMTPKWLDINKGNTGDILVRSYHTGCLDLQYFAHPAPATDGLIYGVFFADGDVDGVLGFYFNPHTATSGSPVTQQSFVPKGFSGQCGCFFSWHSLNYYVISSVNNMVEVEQRQFADGAVVVTKKISGLQLINGNSNQNSTWFQTEGHIYFMSVPKAPDVYEARMKPVYDLVRMEKGLSPWNMPIEYLGLELSPRRDPDGRYQAPQLLQALEKRIPFTMVLSDEKHIYILHQHVGAKTIDKCYPNFDEGILAFNKDTNEITLSSAVLYNGIGNSSDGSTLKQVNTFAMRTYDIVE